MSDNTGLVERLREPSAGRREGECQGCRDELCEEAADRIQALEAERDEAREGLLEIDPDWLTRGKTPCVYPRCGCDFDEICHVAIGMVTLQSSEARALTAEADAASWKADAAEQFLARQKAEGERDSAARENVHLRLLAQKTGCPYGHRSEAGCDLGYPGCACMDDLLATMAWAPEDEDKADIRELLTLLEGETLRLREGLADLLNWADRQWCPHETTHRGGVLWTICDDCGGKWADDEGGFKPGKRPKPIRKARSLLSTPLVVGPGANAPPA